MRKQSSFAHEPDGIPISRRKLLRQISWPILWLTVTIIFAVAVTKCGFMLATNPAS